MSPNEMASLCWLAGMDKQEDFVLVRLHMDIPANRFMVYEIFADRQKQLRYGQGDTEGPKGCRDFPGKNGSRS